MSTYLYSGPATGITFREKDGATTEVMLFPGAKVELPNCPEVETLTALKRLTPVQSTASAAPAAAAVATKAEPVESAPVPVTEAPVDTGASSAGALAPVKKGA